MAGFLVKSYNFKMKIILFFRPMVNWFLRIWLASIFLKSGLLKAKAGMIDLGKYDIFGLNIDLVSKGNWNSTVYLFREEHPVPFISPETAALLGTGAEIIFPFLLIIGLMSRFSAFVLLAMTAFIQITYFQATDHIHWLFLSAIIVCYGADKFSLDYLIKKKFAQSVKTSG